MSALDALVLYVSTLLVKIYPVPITDLEILGWHLEYCHHSHSQLLISEDFL